MLRHLYLWAKLSRADKLANRYDELEELLLEFNAVARKHDQVPITGERESFLGLYNQILTVSYDRENQKTEVKPVNNQQPSLNLKPLEIPRFNGDGFEAYWGIFNSLVGDNPNMSNILSSIII